MMRDIHLGVRLPFETASEQDGSEDILMRLLGLVSRVDLRYILENPKAPCLYDSGVVYAEPDQKARRGTVSRSKLKKLYELLSSMELDDETILQVVRMVKGVEVFLDTPSLYRRRRGDCNELAPVRIAELWRCGLAASPLLTKHLNARGGVTYHALVRWPDGTDEDPSLLLGMGGVARREEAREEVRKNVERYAAVVDGAGQLVGGGADPAQVAAYVSTLGLVPRDGFFRSLR